MSRQAHLIAEERKRIVEALTGDLTQTVRAVTAVARSVILNGPYSANGIPVDIKSKSLGAGVYELYVEVMKP